MPTILDSPRFFDQRPLSEWTVVGETDDVTNLVGRRVAARDEQRQKPLWHLEQWPTPSHPADPISVEVVRGADGPLDDTWTLVIDGLRCDVKRDMTPHEEGREKGLLMLQAEARKLPDDDPVAAAANSFRVQLTELEETQLRLDELEGALGNLQAVLFVEDANGKRARTRAEVRGLEKRKDAPLASGTAQQDVDAEFRARAVARAAATLVSKLGTPSDDTSTDFDAAILSVDDERLRLRAEDKGRLDDLTLAVETADAFPGLTMDELRSKLDEFRARPRTYTLPSGVDPSRELRSDMVVRPVVVGVRLEAEAVAPLEASLELYHVLRSTEMEALDPKNSIEEVTAVQPLRAYRTDDVSATVVNLPYPVRTPNQSSMGIVSFQEVLRWEEKQRSIQAENVMNTVRNRVESDRYADQVDAYNAVGALRSAVRFTSQTAGALSPPLGALVGVGQEFIPSIPAPTLPTRRPDSVNVPIPNSDNQVSVIGGSRSAPGELAEIFRILTVYCAQSLGVYELVREKLAAGKQDGEAAVTFADLPVKKSNESLRYRIYCMRQKVHTRESASTSALLDALLTADVSLDAMRLIRAQIQVALAEDAEQAGQTAPDIPIQADKDYVESLRGAGYAHAKRRYSVCKERAPTDTLVGKIDRLVAEAVDGVAPPAEEELRAAREEAVKELDSAIKAFDAAQPAPAPAQPAVPAAQAPGAQQAASTNAPYSFAYERLRREKLQETNVATGIRIRLRDWRNGEVVFDLQPSAQDGFAASAVMSGLVEEVERFETESNQFVDCMFQTYLREQSIVAAAGAAAAVVEPVVAPVWKLTKKLVRQSPEGVDVLNWANAMVAFFASNEKTKNLGTTLKLNPCDLENRVLEMQVMVRGILPDWPPTTNEVVAEERSLLATAQGTSAPSPAGNDGQDEALGTVDLDDQLTQLRVRRGELTTELKAKRASVSVVDQIVADRIEELLQQATTAILSRELVLASLMTYRSADRLGGNDLVGKLREQRLRNLAKDITARVEGLRQAPDDELRGALERLKDLLGFQKDDPRVYFIRDARAVARVLPCLLTTPGLLSYTFVTPERPAPPASIVDLTLEVAVKNESILNKASGFFTRVGLRIKAVASRNTKSLAAAGAAAAAYPVLGPVASGFFYTVVYYAPLFVQANPWFVGIGLGGFLALEVGRRLLTQSQRDATNRVRIRAANAMQSGLFLAILAELRSQYFASEKQRDIYVESMIAVRGRPVSACFLSAVQTMRVYRARLEKGREARGLRKNVIIAAMYNPLTDERFAFREFYQADPVLLDDLRGRQRVHADVEWSTVPDGSAMRLFPPSDVSDQIYETQVLREVPVQQALALMAGNGGSAALPAQLAAQAAYSEIMQAVVRDRRGMRGDHLVRSTARTAQSLISSAVTILRTCYGPSAGVTLVDGDDRIFTCLRGGVVARLVVRNFDVFAESLELPRDAKAQAEYWISPRRAMVDFFANALLEQAAAAVAAEKPGLPMAASLKSQCEEATRAFLRVQSIDRSGQCALVVASSMAHALWFTNPDTADERALSLKLLREVAAEAGNFADQKVLQRQDSAFDARMVQGSFASRRLDPELVRKLRVEGTRKNLDTILGSLSALSVQDSTRRTYMSPYGSRLQALPGADSFDSGGVNNRLVWTQLLEDVNITFAPAPEGAVVVKGEVVRPFETTMEDRNDGPCAGPSGYARHPCALSACGNHVDVPLVSYPRAAAPVGVTFDTLEQAVLALETEQTGDASAGYRECFAAVALRVRRMRALAFNADRLMHATGLALAGQAGEIHFILPSQEDAVALALAVAMLRVELGLSLVRCTAEAPEGAEQTVRVVQAQFKAARESGVKALSFAEACLGASG
jgi:hypothetical protein